MQFYRAEQERVYQVNNRVQFGQYSQSLAMTEPTYNAINTMLSINNGKGEKFIVEAYNLKISDDFLKLNITDGMGNARAVIHIENEESNLLKNGKSYGDEPKYLILISDFVSYNQKGKVLFEILKFRQLDPPIAKAKIEPSQQRVLDLSKSTTKREVKVEDNFAPKTEKKDNKRAIQHVTPQSYNRNNQQEQESIDDEQLRRFQKISDLYVDFQGHWEIVVRVLDRGYREFNNRSNKLTKIFSMTLVDRTGTKIEGVMFGDNAKEYYELIEDNVIYRMSRGQIRQDSYNSNKGDKFSRFNIIFSRNSSFVRIRDIKAIPSALDTATRLESILNEMNFDAQYDIPAILLSIGEQRTFDKDDGRTIYKKSLVVGDPQTKRSIEVAVWNKEMKIDQKLVGHTILLKSFKLHSYKDSLSLSSVFKSEIISKPDHKFKKYEGKIAEMDFQPISGGRDNDKAANDKNDKATKSIKELENDLNIGYFSQPLYSDLDVMLSHFYFNKKWNYDACNNPKCKKTADSLSKCLSCGTYNDKVQKKFILPIEMADSTGSLWLTAFDEFANDIFKGYNAEDLSRLSENELREEGEKRLYRQYKVRVCTKKEQNGYKHSITGKPIEVNIEKSSITNVEKIKKALYG